MKLAPEEKEHRKQLRDFRQALKNIEYHTKQVERDAELTSRAEADFMLLVRMGAPNHKLKDAQSRHIALSDRLRQQKRHLANQGARRDLLAQLPTVKAWISEQFASLAKSPDWRPDHRIAEDEVAL